MNNNKFFVATFDIGKKNFAFIIEEWDLNELNKIKNIPLKSRYNKDGTLTKDFKKIIADIYCIGKTVLFHNCDLTGDCDKKKYLDPKTFLNMNDKLDEYKEYWNKCDFFVIEQQMSFGRGKQNTMALKLGQHCYSYFTFYYADFKNILEYPAYHKTKILGAVKKLTKPQRKKWAVEIAKEIYIIRNDKENFELLTKSKKKDDISDCLLMSNSFVYLKFIEKYL